MSDSRFNAVTRTAVAEGLLPATALQAGPPARPWPVILVSALGAWMVGIPMFGLITQLFVNLFVGSVGPYLIGLSVLAVAVWVLRGRGHSLFVEQLAVAALVAGAGYLGLGLGRDLPMAAAAAVLAALALLLAVLLPQSWLRLLLGAAACAGVLVAGLDLLLPHGRLTATPAVALVLHLLLLVWLLAPFTLRASLRHGVGPAGALSRSLAWLEAVAAGWLVVTLLGLGVLAGLDEGLRIGAAGASSGFGWAGLMSVLAACGAAALALHRWPLLRQAWLLGVAATLVLLAWFMPALGAVLLALAACATSGRRRLSGLAALVLLWIVSAFYYHLSWSLAEKAALLAASGVWLGLLALWGRHSRSEPARPAEGHVGPPPSARWAGIGSALCAVALLAVVNLGIWRNEGLIRDGRPIFVELMPVDPRSLMQGDYMALDYRMDEALLRQLAQHTRLSRPRVVARVDPRGVALLLRLADDKPLAADEQLLELAPGKGRWVLVSDAWFFREGQGALWQPARYGEFRVTADGKALLVGLADAKLQPIRAPSAAEPATVASR